MTITEAVTKKIKLFSRRRVMTLISGNYDSLFRGRGLEIDSLREYVPGDDVKDIDWKATARTNVTHTRVYTALRDQHIMIVPDTSRSMLLPGYTSLHKRDALYAVSVMLGNFVKQNHDLLAVCAANGKRVTMSRYSSGSHHLERLLQMMDTAINAPQNEQTPLGTVYTHLLGASKKRAAVFVVSDSTPDEHLLKAELTKLAKRHQVFYVQLAPSWPFIIPAVDDEYSFDDIETSHAALPDVVSSTTLQKEWRQGFDDWYARSDYVCRSLGIPHGFVAKAEDVPDVIRKMFIQAKRYARRRG